jgi:hypothetical protein
MDDDGPAGAEAAAVYFLELDSYMQATGDTSEWEAMSHRSCEYCAARLDQAEDIATAGYSWEGGETSARVLHTFAQDAPTGIWPIDVRVADKAAKVTDRRGNEVFSSTGATYERHIEIGRRDGAWVVIGVAKVKANQ